MNDCLVTAMNTESGVYMDGIRGLGYPCYGLVPRSYDPDANMDILENVSLWACRSQDAPLLAEKLTNVFPGKDIKIFNLTSISTRPPGEIKHKQISKDGVFP